MISLNMQTEVSARTRRRRRRSSQNTTTITMKSSMIFVSMMVMLTSVTAFTTTTAAAATPLRSTETISISAGTSRRRRIQHDTIYSMQMHKKKASQIALDMAYTEDTNQSLVNDSDEVGDDHPHNATSTSNAPTTTPAASGSMTRRWYKRLGAKLPGRKYMIKKMNRGSSIVQPIMDEEMQQQQKPQEQREPYSLSASSSSSTNPVNEDANTSSNDDDSFIVRNLAELRHAILQDKIPLKEIVFGPDFTATSNASAVVNATTASIEEWKNHPVLQVIAQRVKTNSTPGHRFPGDTAHIALSIEGGGMRGAVSAGMAAAIASLGLTDAFDSVYGSSAGSIVGSYMISRQMCVDVYTQVLPAAKEKFASKTRVMAGLGVGVVNDLVQRSGIVNGVVQRSLSRNSGYDDDDDDTSTTPDIRKTIKTTITKTTTQKESEELASITSRLSSRFVNPITTLSESIPAVLSSIKPYLTLTPGMNISFVLDGVMSEQHGLRPFDMKSFKRNDAKQPLYAVSSTVRNGKLETVAFSSKDGDYFDMELNQTDTATQIASNETIMAAPKKGVVRRVKDVIIGFVKLPLRLYRVAKFLVSNVRKRAITTKKEIDGDERTTEPKRKRRNHKSVTADKSPLFRRRRRNKKKVLLNTVKRTRNGTIIQEASACPDESGKKGFFACIESSMLVPGAAGAPVKLLRSKHRNDAARGMGVDSMSNICFDAFCYEPIPYRSAVANGATHVLALRSRPDGCVVPTVPGVYEKLVAPVYFRLNGLPQVVQFFESGGSQYRYLEDVLTLDEGLSAGCIDGQESKGVKVPPTDILVGTENDEEITVDTDLWKEAHLMPLTLPAGTPELPTLTQDKDEVLMAVRDGFAAAFDVLAPIAGLSDEFDPSTVDSKKIAELIFPRNSDEDDIYVLENPVNVKGDYIIPPNNNIAEEDVKARRRFASWILRKRKARRKARFKALRNPFRAVAVEVEREMPDTKQYVKEDSLDWLEAESLLAMLPGFQEGKLSHLSTGLRMGDDVQEEAGLI